MYDPLGLSIGTTNLVAACHGSSPVTRRAVLTLYPHCAPKVGVPGQDSHVIEPGMVMHGFVQRVGGSAALLSSDGSAHDPDLLMVEALDAMVVAAGADASSSEISIAVPAYWKPGTVQALRNGLRTHVGFVRSGMAPCLVSDALAAATAVNSECGLPTEGVVGVLDFGGSGTSVTLVNTKSDFELASATMRYVDFSGDELDQALLLHVLDELGHSGDIDLGGTAAMSQLDELRDVCRAAKERLSTDAVTELAIDLADCSTTIQVSRSKLEDLIQDQLTAFIYAFDEMMARSPGGWAELSAVVTVGGGASIPLVTQRLSLHTRRPVLTASQPVLAAATGALTLASRGEELSSRTRTSIGLLVASAAGTRVVEMPAGDVMVIDEDALTDRELAWSQTEFPGDVPLRFAGDSYNEDGPSGYSMRLNVIEVPKKPARRRFRLSQLLIGVCAVVAMTAIGGVAITLAAIENRPAPQTPAPTVEPLPSPPSSVVPSPAQSPPSAPPAPSVAPSTPPPPPSPTAPAPVLTTVAPPPVVTTRTTVPRMTTTTPPPTPTTTTVPTTTTTPPPPTTTTPPPSTATTTTTTVPMTTEWIRVPLLPVPIPVPVPQSQAPQQYPNGGGFQNPFQNPGQ